MNLKLIVNPKAGTQNSTQIIHEIEKQLLRRDVSYDIETTYRAGGATLLAKRAARAGFDMIVGVGGNGTIAEIVNGIIGLDVILGVIPTGKGNDFSKMLGLSGDITEACETLVHGETKKIDLGIINGRYFVSGVGIGLDSEFIKKINSKKEYKNSMLKALLSYKPIKVGLNVDGNKIDKEITSLTVSNSRTFWGDNLIAPLAKIDDGKFDLCITENIGKIKYFLNFKKAYNGEHAALPFVSTMQGKKIILDIPKSSAIHVDGEVFVSESPYQIEVWPKLLWAKAKV